MKKKLLIGVLSLIITLLCTQKIGSYIREHKLQWDSSQEIYRVMKALEEVDENWNLESVSEVRPYEIKQLDSPSIYYYCCITNRLNHETVEMPGLDRNAIAQVVDVDLLENSRICKVDGHEAILGEFDEKNYLCWTISSKYSCVLEYMNDSVTETDILSIAESVR